MSSISINIPVHSAPTTVNVESSFSGGEDIQITGETPIAGDIVLLTLKASATTEKNIIFPKGMMYAKMILPTTLTIPLAGSQNYKFKMTYDGFSWEVMNITSTGGSGTGELSLIEFQGTTDSGETVNFKVIES